MRPTSSADNDPLEPTVHPRHAVLDGVVVVEPKLFIRRYAYDIFGISAKRLLEPKNRASDVAVFFMMSALGFGVMAFVVGVLLRASGIPI
jgi:hypothetical protein